MTPTLTLSGSRPVAAESAPSQGGLAAWIWALTLFTINPQDREQVNEVGSLDPIALLKLALRLGALAALGYLLLTNWGQRDRHRAVWLLAPLGLYLVWAFASTVWSPLKSVSLGQLVSLLMLSLLSAVVAVIDRGEATSRHLLQHTTWALSAFSLLMLGRVAVSGGVDDRFGFYLAHPTLVGGTASLAVVLLLVCSMLWRMDWARWLLVPGLLLNGSVMLLAMNRTAMLSAAAVIAVLIVVYSDRVLLAAGGLLASLCLLAVAAFDPSWQWLFSGAQLGGDFLAREQTVDQLAALSGREEMWTVMWESFLESPWLGHGYFVTTSEGIVTVWGREANFNAHNMLLQALVSTGIVGAAVFLWAIGRPLIFALSSLGRDSEAARRGGLFVLVCIWLAVWGLCDVALLGPVTPFVIVFFVALGLLAGVATREETAQRGLSS